MNDDVNAILAELVAARHQVAKAEDLAMAAGELRRRFEVLQLCATAREVLTVAHSLIANGERAQ